MKRFYQSVSGDYIVAIGIGDGGTEITSDDYELLLTIIQNRPIAEEGYTYMLRNDWTWEQVKNDTDDSSQELSGDEFMNMLEEVL